jgi:diguanylate cyclase (GGDEF)-like protein
MRGSVDQVRSNRRLRANTAAAMFGFGALIGVVEDFIPGGAPVSIVAGLIALAAAVAVVICGPRLPDWACALLGPFAVGLIAYALTFNAGPGDGAVLYMWPVLWTVFFFGRRGAIAIVACVAVAHGGVLLSLPAHAGYFNRWIDVMASTTIVAAMFELLVTRNERLVERLAGEARIDGLTGALNRRGFDERAAVELAHARREQRSLAVVILDIDHFKRVNDEWGHDTGDLALASLARLVASCSREIDAVARIGGEEFAVLMPGATSQDANAFTERIRDALAHPRHDKLPMIRVSAGVASDDPPTSIEALLQAADRGLYAAKRNGRNRTMVATDHSRAVAATLTGA